MAWGKQEREKRWWRIGVGQVVCGKVVYGQVVLYVCMHACNLHVCMHVWMDGWMDGCMDAYIYGVKWLQMTQVRQSHPTQTCHSVRKSASDAAEAAEVHAQSMSPSTTHATWNEGGCLQVPRLPRQQPRRPRVPRRPKRATGASVIFRKHRYMSTVSCNSTSKDDDIAACWTCQATAASVVM